MSLVPLTVDGAQGHAPKVGAEAGQLGDIVRHLQRHTAEEKYKDRGLFDLYMREELR